jgi:cysteinyl-tRNA synthetase
MKGYRSDEGGDCGRARAGEPKGPAERAAESGSPPEAGWFAARTPLNLPIPSAPMSFPPTHPPMQPPSGPAAAPTLSLYNTLSRSLEAFKPLDRAGRTVTFYSCGPTVYDYAHIGNFRSFLNADVLRRTLELLGYQVRHVMNITDVGHMTDDGNADGGGEDRMAVAGRRLAEAKKAGKLPDGVSIDPNDPYAIAEFYAQAFLEDSKTLGLKVAFDRERDPTLMPRPTRYVKEMIALVTRLIERNHAYVGRDGVVYFDVRSFPEYGKLSGNTLDNLREGAGERISAENQANKRNPADFMLWKPDATHIMRWPSPWGEGYPGWHLECSAMAASLLGEEIDLHSGGEDNIFPHHECEIAQSCGASGHSHFARAWFHTRHLQVEGDKMSKSKGNFFTARDMFAKGVTPAALRLELRCRKEGRCSKGRRPVRTDLRCVRRSPVRRPQSRPSAGRDQRCVRSRRDCSVPGARARCA